MPCAVTSYFCSFKNANTVGASFDEFDDTPFEESAEG